MTGRIDAHCHVWRLERGDYGWLRGENGPLAPIRRDFGPADLAAVSEDAGIDAAILVQAAPTVAETRFLLDAARSEARIAGVVGWVDLADPASVAVLEELARDPAFKGVRPMLQDLADPDWIATSAHPGAIAALGRLELRFDALATPAQLPGLRRLVERHPELPVIVNHAAKPALGGPAGDPRHADYRRDMRALADHARVFCKLSGLLTELPAEQRRSVDAAATALGPLVGDLIEWFGPERLAWGSDWPVLTLAAPFEFWCAVTERLLTGLAAEHRAAILGGTAARFYGLGTGVPA